MSARRAGSVLALTWSLTVLGCMQKHPEPVKLPPAIVQVAVPLQRNVTDYNVFTATTQAEQSVEIKARVTGYLMKILFNDGDIVIKDQPLFIIDQRPYKATLDKAIADIDYSKASLVKAQAEYDIVLKVQAGDKGAISAAEVAKKLGDRDQAAASVKQAEAVKESAQLNYDWCTVVSPIDGRINRHFVDAGNLVSQDTTALTNIVSLRPIWVYFYVDQNTSERYQQLIGEGKIVSARKETMPVSFALGSDANFSYHGGIDFLSNQFDASTGTFTVRAVLPNEDEKKMLYGGEFGRVRVPASADHLALLVAEQAIGTNQGQRYVLIVNDKDVVESRAVQTGQVHGGFREVLRYRTISKAGPDGKNVTEEVEVLKPTDRLIVSGLQRVRPGMKVEPQTVLMETLVAGTKPDTSAAPKK